MRRKAVLLISYFTLAPIVIVVTILTSLYFFHHSNTSSKHSIAITAVEPHYESLPEDRNKLQTKISLLDARIPTLEEYFEKYDSPLSGHAQKIVEEADKHSLDYRLIPAIAMKESTLCKKIPKNSFNCWGFGIYGGKITRFKSYEHAIETISKALSENYVQKGYETPHQMMEKYAPSSEGTWAIGVNYVMNQIASTL